MNGNEPNKSSNKEIITRIKKDLLSVETLLNKGQDFEAIPTLNELVEKSGLPLLDEITLSSLLIRVGDWENTVKIAEDAYEKAQNSQNYLQLIHALLNLSHALKAN